MTDTTRGDIALMRALRMASVAVELDHDERCPTGDCPTCHMQPGSDTARKVGCSCPVLDNGHGHNIQLTYRLDCPVEHPMRGGQS